VSTGNLSEEKKWEETGRGGGRVKTAESHLLGGHGCVSKGSGGPVGRSPSLNLSSPSKKGDPGTRVPVIDCGGMGSSE